MFPFPGLEKCDFRSRYFIRASTEYLHFYGHEHTRIRIHNGEKQASSMYIRLSRAAAVESRLLISERTMYIVLEDGTKSAFSFVVVYSHTFAFFSFPDLTRLKLRIQKCVFSDITLFLHCSTLVRTGYSMHDEYRKFISEKCTNNIELEAYFC